MTTYVLGAGASLHAGYPLAGGLGEALRAWIYRTKPADNSYRIHIDQLSELYGGLGNLESVLTDLGECLPGSRAATLQPPIVGNLLSDLRHSIREFFNDLRQEPAPLYSRLARERIQSGDVIITFNYEAACERELKQAGLWEIGDGYGFSVRSDAILPSKVKVLKLHGSTNWWGLIFGGATGFSQVSNMLGPRPVVFFLPDLEFLGYSGQLRDSLCAGIDEATGTPALILPTQRKRFFEQTSFGREWEFFWDDLWAQAGSALESSEKIVIIGYRMASVDERAKKLLLQHSNPDAEIAIFSGQSSSGICSEFKALGFERIKTFGEGHFKDYLGAS